MLRLFSALARLCRKEDGNATVEFVIVFPAIMFLVLSGLELAFVTLRHAQLERAVDLTVRDIRLNTGTSPQHDEIKALICDRAIFINNCAANLRLEMIRQDPFATVTVPTDPDCTDLAEVARPVRTFENGLENELMVLRACAKINPVFPTSAMGRALVNEEGQYALTATTVFVQEPL
ncbi:TadE/TadG family type IV pilus assembly protein [Ruegeria arenilitoris]|uniref:TadE/TadG family type IV pilus assembly protein n=1 Tax=Ruegeria arenilitoris TaxID=1173585 RepID=UPI0014806CBE|nr:TadE/TadG family type IV pilus assembly protein [Ruegeria arenilitoris]